MGEGSCLMAKKIQHNTNNIVTNSMETSIMVHIKKKKSLKKSHPKVSSVHLPRAGLYQQLTLLMKSIKQNPRIPAGPKLLSFYRPCNKWKKNGTRAHSPELQFQVYLLAVITTIHWEVYLTSLSFCFLLF